MALNKGVQARREAWYREVVSKLSNEDKAYLAGIIDGEGSFVIVTQGKKNGRKTGIGVIITIGCTSSALLLWLVTKLPQIGTFCFTSSRKGHKNSWTWRVSTRQTEVLTTAIRPWLKIKAPQADHVLATIRLIAPHGTRYSEEQQRLYDAAIATAKDLNLVGRSESGLRSKEEFQQLVDAATEQIH